MLFVVETISVSHKVLKEILAACRSYLQLRLWLLEMTNNEDLILFFTVTVRLALLVYKYYDQYCPVRFVNECCTAFCIDDEMSTVPFFTQLS